MLALRWTIYVNSQISIDPRSSTDVQSSSAPSNQVGMAVLLLPDLRLHLLQFVETSRSYVVTLTALEQYQPAEVLVVASQHEEVATGLNDATRRLRQVALPRAYFDDSKVPSFLPFRVFGLHTLLMLM
jgi:hypothetical protein